MAEQWIDAVTTFKLVAGTTTPAHAAEALCTRASEGLVIARARVLVVGDQRSEDALVPAVFWSVRSKLEEHWAVGDFSGRTDRRAMDRWQAFGVRFGLGRVLDMLPFEQRAATARQMSVAGNPAWIPARQATTLVGEAHGVGNGPEAILEQARLGFVTGRAVLAQRFAEWRTVQLLWEEREWDIPPGFWEACARADRSLQDWDLGPLRGEVPSRGEAVSSNHLEWMYLGGVHFLSESLQGLVSAIEAAPFGEGGSPETPPKSRAGGRHPQAWWDDMWCDIWGLIYHGDFKPASQADVERAMMTWASRKGYELAEATARVKARRLFRAYTEEATNFLAS